MCSIATLESWGGGFSGAKGIVDFFLKDAELALGDGFFGGVLGDGNIDDTA